MHEDGSAGVLAQLAEATDVINMGVSADDGFDGKAVTAEKFENAGDFVAGVNNKGFARYGIADDRAIALKHSHGNGDVDQALGNGVECGNGVAHHLDYNIACCEFWNRALRFAGRAVPLRGWLSTLLRS
jgi:hypothetical protein